MRQRVAQNSTSVDASGTYLEWFKANLALNGFQSDSTAVSVLT